MQGRAADILGVHLAARDGHGHRERSRILRGLGALWRARRQTQRLVKGGHLDPVDIPRRQAMPLAQVKRCAHRRLRPAAHRKRFEILLKDEPALPKVGPDIRNLGRFHRHRRRTGKAIRRQIGRRHPRHRAPARPILEHRGMVDAAHHLTAWSVILGDPDGLAGLPP